MSRDGSLRNAARSSRKGKQQRKPAGAVATTDPPPKLETPAPPANFVEWLLETEDLLPSEREGFLRILRDYQTSNSRLEQFVDLPLSMPLAVLFDRAWRIRECIASGGKLPFQCPRNDDDEIRMFIRAAAEVIAGSKDLLRAVAAESRGRSAHQEAVDLLNQLSFLLHSAAKRAVLHEEAADRHFQKLLGRGISAVKPLDLDDVLTRMLSEAIRTDGKVPNNRGWLSVLMDSIMDPRATHTIRPEQVAMEPMVATINKRRPWRAPVWVEPAGTQPPEAFVTNKYGPTKPIGFIRGNLKELGWVLRMVFDEPSESIPLDQPQPRRQVARFVKSRAVWVRAFDGALRDCFFKDLATFHRADQLLEEFRRRHKEDTKNTVKDTRRTRGQEK
jgi:hypothetical protein